MATLASMTVRLGIDTTPMADGIRRARRAAGSMVSRIGEVLRNGISSAFESGMSGLRGVMGSISSNPYVAGIGLAIAAGIVATAVPMIGALLSGAVIAVGGLSIIGVSYALLKDEPKVKQAAKRLTDAAKTTFKSAAQPMIKPLSDAFHDLANFIEDIKPSLDGIFKSATGLVKPLVDGVEKLAKNALPGFANMMKTAGPVFDSLGKALGDIGTGLSGMFDAISAGGPGAAQAIEDIGKAIEYTLIVIGVTISILSQIYKTIRDFITNVINLFKWLYDVLVGHSIVPDLMDRIVELFGGLPGRILGGLGNFVTSVIGTFALMGAQAVSRVVTTVTSVAGWFARLPGKAAGALAALPGAVLGKVRSATSQMLSSISKGISSAVRYIRGLPGKARSALGNLGGTLYSAGKSLIRGLINGITAMIPSLVAKLTSVTNRLPDWKGPADKDATILKPAGQLVIQGFINGINSAAPSLRSALQRVTADIPANAGVRSVAYQSGMAASQEPRVVIDVTGAESDFKKFIRGMVRVDGRGDVQRTFGAHPVRS